jgi:hypothetical protein
LIFLPFFGTIFRLLDPHSQCGYGFESETLPKPAVLFQVNGTVGRAAQKPSEPPPRYRDHAETTQIVRTVSDEDDDEDLNDDESDNEDDYNHRLASSTSSNGHHSGGAFPPPPTRTQVTVVLFW